LAPGVEGVVDEGALIEKAMVVVFNFETADTNGQQCGPERIGLEVFGDIGGVDDPSQPDQRTISPQFELFDEDFEGAFAVPVGEVGAGSVEGPPAQFGCRGEYLAFLDVDDFGGGVDESADQPGTGDPVGLGTGAGDPFHMVSFLVGRGTVRNQAHKVRS
jgi:hypothetical protein